MKGGFRMYYITRSQWYRKAVETFLDSQDKVLCLDLYKSEVRYVEKHYPVQVSMTALRNSQRFSCIIEKNA